jgi:hypothetical protein
MLKQVTDFLIELSKDPLRADQFKTDRVRFIAEAGFTGREAEILMTSDPTAVRSYLSENDLEAAAMGEGGGFKKPPKPPKPKPAKKPKKPAKKPAKKGGRK